MTMKRRLYIFDVDNTIGARVDDDCHTATLRQDAFFKNYLRDAAFVTTDDCGAVVTKYIPFLQRPGVLSYIRSIAESGVADVAVWSSGHRGYVEAVVRSVLADVVLQFVWSLPHCTMYDSGESHYIFKRLENVYQKFPRYAREDVYLFDDDPTHAALNNDVPREQFIIVPNFSVQSVLRLSSMAIIATREKEKKEEEEEEETTAMIQMRKDIETVYYFFDETNAACCCC
jgi:NLI interacting factor-like phosphatase